MILGKNYICFECARALQEFFIVWVGDELRQFFFFFGNRRLSQTNNQIVNRNVTSQFIIQKSNSENEKKAWQ